MSEAPKWDGCPLSLHKLYYALVEAGMSEDEALVRLNTEVREFKEARDAKVQRDNQRGR
jgi:hypothetical protein